METKPLKNKKCRECKALFTPKRPLQVCCSIPCAMANARKKSVKVNAEKAKIERKEHHAAKQKAKSRGQWLKEAQITFNAFIRKRDEGKPCISCGSYTGKKNAGHYSSVGSCPELRFEPLQVWLQCEKCNSYLSGNLINYRIELVRRIGVDKVQWLEGPHEPKKYTIDELKAIKTLYLNKIKELKRAN